MLIVLLGLIPFDVLPPSANPTTGAVYPRQSNGFAAGVIGGFLALGILMLAMFLLNLKPKRVNRP